jgi:hypothetical protein
MTTMDLVDGDMGEILVAERRNVTGHKRIKVS